MQPAIWMWASDMGHFLSGRKKPMLSEYEFSQDAIRERVRISLQLKRQPAACLRLFCVAYIPGVSAEHEIIPACLPNRSFY